MKEQDLWNNFYLTGSIADYLAYKTKAGNGENSVENKNSNPRAGNTGNAGGGK